MSTILFDQQPETTAPQKTLNRRLIGWSVGGVLIVVAISFIGWRITHALTAKPQVAVAAIPAVIRAVRIDPVVLGFTALACILAWSASQVGTAMRMQILYVEPDGKS